MGLMEQEIKELRGMIARIDQGTIDTEEINSKVAIYSQIQKRSEMILKASAMMLKHGKKNGVKELTDSNLVGGGIQIENDLSKQIISCPDIGTAITREQCLDYSGEAAHHESCRTCENFNTTRRMLCKKENGQV